MIPERYNGFKCYFDGIELPGVVKAELPSLEAMTETLSGAGILGELETPTVGNFSSPTMTINWRTAGKPQSLLMYTADSHLIELRGSVQEKDRATGMIESKQLRVQTRSRVKTSNYGSVEVNSGGDPSTEFSVEYLKITLDGAEQLEYDPLNYVYRVNGTDQLAQIRANIN